MSAATYKNSTVTNEEEFDDARATATVLVKVTNSLPLCGALNFESPA
jgi:hypothetical protein